MVLEGWQQEPRSAYQPVESEQRARDFVSDLVSKSKVGSQAVLHAFHSSVQEVKRGGWISSF